MEIFVKIKARITLKPPAVDPADPPINISIRRMTCEKSGQTVKSVIPKPVVVITLDTSKKAISNPLPALA